jgi:hypothetical protein
MREAVRRGAEQDLASVENIEAQFDAFLSADPSVQDGTVDRSAAIAYPSSSSSSSLFASPSMAATRGLRSQQPANSLQPPQNTSTNAAAAPIVGATKTLVSSSASFLPLQSAANQPLPPKAQRQRTTAAYASLLPDDHENGEGGATNGGDGNGATDSHRGRLKLDDGTDGGGKLSSTNVFNEDEEDAEAAMMKHSVCWMIVLSEASA